MTATRRQVVAALRFVFDRPAEDLDTVTLTDGAARFLPLGGILAGSLAAAAYWACANWWPSSVAVACVLAIPALLHRHSGVDQRLWMLLLLIDFNVLTALSSARAPIPLPPHLTLGLIIVAGQAVGLGLAVSVLAADPASGITYRDLCIATVIALAPAALLGIPGLMGFAAAVCVRLALFATRQPPQIAVERRSRGRIDLVQRSTETCFYLGALAGWKYI